MIENQPLTLLCDGQCLLHRARSGFVSEHSVVFNMFRSLRALIEQFNPTRVVFTREGVPIHRLQLDSQYKANRKTDDPVKIATNNAFYKQCDAFTELCAVHIPISIVRHPHFEADDTIANLILPAPTCVQFVIVSTDSDFTQLLDRPNVRLFNPVEKLYVPAPTFDYVAWKSLTGDNCDNVPGLPGFGPKTAEKLVRERPTRVLIEHTLPTDELRTHFRHNLQLIEFKRWSDNECMEMESSSPTRDWDAVAEQFQRWAFASILKEKAWKKFTDTFDALWVNI